MQWRTLIVFPEKNILKTSRCRFTHQMLRTSSKTRIITWYRGGGRRKTRRKKGRAKGKGRRKSLTPVSNGAVTCFTRTSGLTDPASGHYSSGVTWCLSSPLPAFPTHFALETGRGSLSLSLSLPLFMVSPVATVHSDSVVSPRNTENGLCQGAWKCYLRDEDRG